MTTTFSLDVFVVVITLYVVSELAVVLFASFFVPVLVPLVLCILFKTNVLSVAQACMTKC